LQGASGLIGLVMADRVTRAASISDRPPVTTAGEGTLGILAQDTTRDVYNSLGVGSRYDPNSAQITGLTPFSYAAGTIPLIRDGQVSANLLSGHFGAEAGLIADAAERSGSLLIGGSDNLSGQAVLFAMAQEPLIGEEIFAGGAYLGAGALHEASLRTQDVLRWALVILILIGAILEFSGLSEVIASVIEGYLP
jgi:hypothetical protein